VSDHFVLKYGSEKHSKIKEAIRARKRLSERKLADRRTAWAEAENKFMLAQNAETANDNERKTARKNGKPQLTTIEIPYSYAMLLSTHTYISSVFLSRTPVFQFMARHGEPENAVMGLEAIIDYQTQVGGALVPYYIWIHDQLKYGLGVVSTYWSEEFSTVTEITEEETKFLGIPIGEKKKVRRTKRIPGYSGNKVFNVRPQDWYPDPRVTLANFQKGEFCGRYVEVGWNTLLRGKESGQYYNLDALAAVAKRQASDRDRGGSAMTIPDLTQEQIGEMSMAAADKGFFGVMEMEVDLVPRDWGLGSGTLPEKWIFSLGNGEVIIESRPLTNAHGQFNFDILEYEIEGYNLSKRGMIELLNPLNDTMEWLLNTHLFNVRKSLNDQFVVDPSRIVMRDITDPNAGKLIRLKPEAYGTDTRLAVSQLVTNDVTRTHVNDSAVIGDLMQRATGAVDNIMGMVNNGGRKTATEVRTSSSFGVNRLKTLTEYSSAMGFAPHAQRLVSNTQQYLTVERAYRIAGDLAPDLEKFVSVSPESLQGFFDFVPVDGAMPVDRFAQANLWKELLVNMRNIPQLAQAYDLAGIFSWIAKLSGMRNINQFKIQITPDQQFAANLQAGNSVPINGGGNGNSGAGASASGPSQIPGVGPLV
jgi:hypothetical protein